MALFRLLQLNLPRTSLRDADRWLAPLLRFPRGRLSELVPADELRRTFQLSTQDYVSRPVDQVRVRYAARADGENQGRLTDLLEFLQARPSDVHSAALTHAAMLHSAGDPSAAVERLERLLARTDVAAEERVQACQLLVWATADRRDWPSARARVRGELDRPDVRADPRLRASLDLELARLDVLDGRPAAAVDRLRELYEVTLPTAVPADRDIRAGWLWADAGMAYGCLLDELGRPAEARQAWRRAYREANRTAAFTCREGVLVAGLSGMADADYMRRSLLSPQTGSNRNDDWPELAMVRSALRLGLLPTDWAAGVLRNSMGSDRGRRVLAAIAFRRLPYGQGFRDDFALFPLEGLRQCAQGPDPRPTDPAVEEAFWAFGREVVDLQRENKLGGLLLPIVAAFTTDDPAAWRKVLAPFDGRPTRGTLAFALGELYRHRFANPALARECYREAVRGPAPPAIAAAAARRLAGPDREPAPPPRPGS